LLGVVLRLLMYVSDKTCKNGYNSYRELGSIYFEVRE
jgi:hypothetical protein